MMAQLYGCMRCRRGAVGVMFAFIALVLVVLVACVTDVARVSLVRAKAQQALDSAALAAVQLPPEEMETQANAFFTAQLQAPLGAEFTPVMMDGDVQMRLFTVQGGVPNLLAPMVGGAAETTLAVSAAVAQTPIKAEMAVIIDSAENMDFGAVQAGVSALLAGFYAHPGSAAESAISLISYAQGVKIDPAFSEDWRRPDGSAAAFDGCLRARGNAYDTTAQAPVAGDDETLFPRVSGGCTLAESAFLTQSAAAGEAFLQSLTNGVAVNSAEGLAWGWYSLDAGWQGLLPGNAAFPKPYGNAPKVAVLIAHSANTDLDDDARVSALCQGMKEVGITLYSAAWDSDGATASLLKACASDEAHHIATADAEKLKTFLRRIPASLSTWHIVPQPLFGGAR